MVSTTQRVPMHTSEHVNRQIREEMEARIQRYRHAPREVINRRLEQLDQEWDIERTLEANAATACLIGVTLGATVDRRWFYFPAVIGAFLLQHAVQGWCPPLPVFRRLGVRTQSEIEAERYALKVLRGDFRAVSQDQPAAAERVLEAVDREA